MIGCEVSGGLGNQFFRYAYSRCLQERRRKMGKEDVLVINYGAIESHGFAGDLNDFRIAGHKRYNCRRVLLQEGSIMQIIVYAIVTRICGLIKRLLKYEPFDAKCRILGLFGIIISEKPDNERLYCNMNAPKVFPVGSFENVTYFEQIKDVLGREFTPIHDELPKNKALYDIIRNTNSICVAVRRGDFMTDENRKTFYVCDLSYFRKAIEYMQQSICNPTFIVFSNDIEWVKDNLKFGGNIFYESGTDPVWETFRLMRSCKHFIISNSTLHWWAQYLCVNPNKIVIAPDRWYNPPSWNEHLMLDYFVRLKTGVVNPYGDA